MVQIIPSLLVSSEQEFRKHLAGLEKSVDMIQVDIADGMFVENKTWADPQVIKDIVSFDLEIHLMVGDPIAVMNQWKDVPQVKRALIHYESLPNIEPAIGYAKAQNWQVGIVLNPDTPIAVLDSYLDHIDTVMFMGVYPGAQGKPFVPEVLDKIRAFKEKKTGHSVEIDGHVGSSTITLLIEAGVDIVCPGSAIFGNDQAPKENVEEMKTLIRQLTRE